jgi:hypothetical protein
MFALNRYEAAMTPANQEGPHNEKNWIWFKADFLLAMLSRASPDPKLEAKTKEKKASKPKGRK